MTRTVLLLAALLGPGWDIAAGGAEPEVSAYRTWTLLNGSQLVGPRALIGFRGGTVILKDRSGEIQAVPFTAFTPDDQEHVHARHDPGRDLPPQTLKRLKAATVLVWDSYETIRSYRAAAGFLVHRDGRTGLVATDSMAITVPKGYAPGKLAVIFHSGTAAERRVEATTVAPRRNIANTTVLLRVESDDLPEPIDIAQRVSLFNAMPVYVLGFAFRATEPLSPTIHPQVLVHETVVPNWPLSRINTVCPADLTLRYDRFIEGSPVVDWDGALVGVVSHAIKRDLANAAEVRPAANLRSIVRGDVDTPFGSPWQALRANPTSVTYFLFAKLLDPQHAVRSAALLSVAAEYPLETIEPTSDGSWEPLLGNVVETPLTIKAGYVCGSLNVPRGEKRYLQIKFAEGAGAGNIHYLEPKFTLTGPAWPDYQLLNGGTAPGTDMWEGSVDDRELSRPVGVDQVLAGERRPVDDAWVTPVRLPAADIVGQMQWSSDGQWLYVLQKDGLLRKLRVPEFREVLRRETLRQKKVELSRSQEGLVVVMNDTPNQLWVIDEQTLEVKRRIRVRGATHAACSPVRSGAVVTGADENQYLVDLKEGHVREHVKASTLREQWLSSQSAGPYPPPDEFHLGLLTPDGQDYFFAHKDALCRCRFDGRRLSFEQAAAPLGCMLQSLAASADGRLVGMACQPGGTLIVQRPEITNACVIYAREDLQSPPLVLQTGASPRVLAFDPVTGSIYTHNDACQLLVFNAAGQKVRELKSTLR